MYFTNDNELPVVEQVGRSQVTKGNGAILAYKTSSMDKFEHLAELLTVPFAKKTETASDYQTTAMPTAGKITGVPTLEELEAEFYYTRDILRKLDKLKKEESITFMSIAADLTGQEWKGTFSYSISPATTGEVMKGTIKFTPNHITDTIYPNAYEFYRPSAVILEIPNRLLATSGKSEEFTVNPKTDPTDATITAKSDNTAVTVKFGSGGTYGETATSSQTDTTLMIKSDGTLTSGTACLVTLTSNKANYGSVTRTILIFVK